jgi:hypothetical protein
MRFPSTYEMASCSHYSHEDVCTERSAAVDEACQDLFMDLYS